MASLEIMNKNVRNVPVRVSLTTTNIIKFVEKEDKNNCIDTESNNHILYISNLRPNVTTNNLKQLSNYIHGAHFETKDTIR